MPSQAKSRPADSTGDKLFEELLAASSNDHGHLCAGQVVGVRMALLGLKLIGISVPVSHQDIKKLLVYVEMDRCAGDAVAHVSGVKLGRRSLKFKDYGIMAATFLNLETRQAFRVLSTEESRNLVDVYAPGEADPKARQLAGYKAMPDHLMFRVQRVEVDLSQFDLPGPTRMKTVCAQCGQVIRDNRQQNVDGRTLCGLCAPGSYILSAEEVDLESGVEANRCSRQHPSKASKDRDLKILPLFPASL